MAGTLIPPSRPVWKLPEPLATRDVCVDDDTVVTLRRHGNPDGPRLLLSHGNGLAIDLYYPFWSLLTDDFDVVVFDLRNHGWNTVSSRKGHNVPTMVDDHERIIEATDRYFGEKPKIGVFHSVSALVSLLSPAKGSGYEALVLFDPPLCKPGQSYEDFDAATERAATMARRRAERFHSLSQLVEALHFVPAYQRVVPGVYDLLAQTTLCRCEDGDGYRLRCPRDYEAQLLEYACVYAVIVNFDSFRCAIKVIGADPTLPFSYLPSLDLSDILRVDYDFLPDATHFLQLEQPNECVATMRAFLDELTIT